MFIRFDVIHEHDRRTLHDSKDRAYASHRAVKTSLYCLQPACDARWHRDEGGTRTTFTRLNFCGSDQYSLLVSSPGAIENVCENAYNLIACPGKSPDRRGQMLTISLKNCANESPLKCKFVGKIPNFDGLWAAFPHFCPDKLGWHAVLMQINSRLSGQRVAPAGRKVNCWSTE